MLSKNNKGFSLIELLIALIILATVIVSLNTVFKQYFLYRQKQKFYEDIYSCVLSLKDEIKNKDLSKPISTTGKINGIFYKISVNKISQSRNFIYASEPDKIGNFGKFLVILYKITLRIAGKKFVFYETQYKRL